MHVQLGLWFRYQRQRYKRYARVLLQYSFYTTYFYIYVANHSQLRPKFLGSIAINAVQRFRAYPTAAHVATQVAPDIFPNCLRYRTLLYSVPRECTITTFFIVLQQPCLPARSSEMNAEQWILLFAGTNFSAKSARLAAAVQSHSTNTCSSAYIAL